MQHCDTQIAVNSKASICLLTWCGRSEKRFAANVLNLLLLGSIIVGTGCQSVHPFAQKTKAKIASAQQWASNGLDAFQEGHLDKAKNFFSRAAESNPSDYQNRANLARTLNQSNDRQQAIIEMQHAVDQSNGDPKLLVELGEMYLQAGQWFPAKHQVELALKSNARYAPAWALSGKTAKAKGDYHDALGNFQRALGYDPEMSDVQLEIVDTYQRMGESLRALAAVEQFLSKHPKDDQPIEAVIAKSVALLNLQHYSPAVDLLQSASEKKTATSEIFVRLGQAHILSGNASQARIALNRGQSAFPNMAIFAQLASQVPDNQENRVATKFGDWPTRN